MKTSTLIAAAIASILAVSAAAPVFAAEHPRHHKQINRMLHRADTNRDGRVSQAEMLAALGRSFAVLDTKPAITNADFVIV